MEKTRKWRWGVNRWIILGLSLLGILGVNLVTPVQPHLSVAAELIKFHLFGMEFAIPNTITAMILGDIVIIWIALSVRNSIKGGGLAPGGIQGMVEAMVEMGYNLVENTAGKWAKTIFPWFASIFFVVIVANLVKLLPGFETVGIMEHVEHHGYKIQEWWFGSYYLLPVEAEKGGYALVPFFRGLTTDLNFTAALAVLAVVFTQVVGIQSQGLKYFTKFLNFTTIFKKPLFGAIDFAVGLLETISEFAKILSFSFRLFGNMFAGMVLVALIGTMMPVFMPSAVFLFEFGIGIIQAFVFGMLTLVFMSMATQGHSEEEHPEH